jgi:ATP-binding cassette, subfamily B, bacterial PglK
MFGIAILIPLFDFLQNKLSDQSQLETAVSENIINELFHFINFNDINSILLFIIFFFILKNTLIFLLSYFQFKIIFSNDIWLRKKLLEKYLDLDYSSYSKIKQSDLIRNTADQVGQISYGSLLSALTIMSEFSVIFLIIFFIFFSLSIEQSILIISVFLIGLVPYLIYKNKLIYLGKEKFNSTSKTINEIQNIYNLNIEIRLYQLKYFFLNRINYQSKIYVNSQIKYNLISILPKGVIEISAVLILVLLLSNSSNDEFLIHELGIIVASIFRIAPSFTRISSSLTQLKFSFQQINTLYDILNNFKSVDVKGELNSSIKKNKNFKTIELNEIDFSYNNKDFILNKFNLKIIKGDLCIIKGESGVGKTTLIKILMGLLKPDNGKIYIDDNLSIFDSNEWQKSLSYVPQNPTIIEGNLMQNICLGIDHSKIDKFIYSKTIDGCQLSKLHKDLDGKIITSEGTSISGGQKQRIAIARALYRKSNVIIMDEPTSSLDKKNKNLIVKLINKINKSNKITVIVITHTNDFDKYSNNKVNINLN